MNEISRGTPKLRFGIMIDDNEIPKWTSLILHSLARSEVAQLCLVIYNGATQMSPYRRRLRALRPSRHLLFRIYRDFIFRPPANTPVSLVEYIGDAPRITVTPRLEGRYSQVFDRADVDEIKARSLDFILRFGFNIVRGDILNAARHGVWSGHFDDERIYRGGPPCFWEVYNGDAITGAILQRLTHRLDAGVILKRASFRTVDWSYSANFDRVAIDTFRMASDVCNDILQGCASYLRDNPSHTTAPIYRSPTNFQMMRFVGRIAVRRARRLF